MVHSSGLLIFGGYTSDFKVTNALQRLDVGAQAWAEVPVSGPRPSARCEHAAVLMPVAARATTVVFGGRDVDANAELWLFDVAAANWTEVKPKRGAPWPAARTQHCLADLHGRLVMVGGVVAQQDHVAWVYSFDHREWEVLRPSATDSGSVPGFAPTACATYPSWARPSTELLIHQPGQATGLWVYTQPAVDCDNATQAVAINGTRCEDCAEASFVAGGVCVPCTGLLPVAPPPPTKGSIRMAIHRRSTEGGTPPPRMPAQIVRKNFAQKISTPN